MWNQYNYWSYVNPNWNGMYSYPTYDYRDMRNFSSYSNDPNNMDRQRPIRGQATWTDGGQVTKCGIPWSKNEYMTVAVAANSPYKCGQTLKIRNLSTPVAKEIIVTVVDHVQGYQANKMNLHRKAFEALGSNPNIGVINIEIISSPELEEEKWGKYLLEVTKIAYPSYQVTDYKFAGRSEVSPTQTKETYEYILQSPQDHIKIQGNVLYNPVTDRVITIDIKEVAHFNS